MKGLAFSRCASAFTSSQSDLGQRTWLTAPLKVWTEGRGLSVIIAAAGGAAHLPGMVASKTLLPVLGVPIPATVLNGFDALMSIVQMPKGVPVGTMAIGKPGAINAALYAASILSLKSPELRARLAAWRQARTDEVLRDREIA